MNFIDTGLNANIINAISELGFETPTPIQQKAIPHIINSNQDLVALAQTGTGKTAAFGLPAIQLTQTDLKYPQTLILCPTRELCLQITKDIDSYAKQTRNLRTVAVYGGASIENQIRDLRKGAHIVVGTPGRTRDLINRKKLWLDNIERVVLDEADEMLTMGFKEELDAILEVTPATKQTLLFSATMSKEVAGIAKRYMSDPAEITVARKNIGAANVEHIFYQVHTRDRYEALKRIADMNPSIYGIVFCRTRRETKEVSTRLMTDGYNADALHGDLSQAQRDEVMNKFRKNLLQILVATDVAARGLDVDSLTHVINYNLPDNPEIYTHRSGRTGRAGKSGISIAIVNRQEIRKIQAIERYSKIKFNKGLVPTGPEICNKQLFAFIDKMEKVQVDEQQIAPFLEDVYNKLEWLDREQLIKHFVSLEFNRFLEYYKNACDLNVSDRSSRADRKSQRAKVRFARLFVNVGSKNKLNPARLIGMVNEALDSSEAGIGRIEILKKFTFFEVDETFAPSIIAALDGDIFEGVELSLEMAASKAPAGGRSRSGGGRNDRFRGPRKGGGKGKRSFSGDRRKKKRR